MIKNWSRKVLEGLVFLHENEIVHGKLTCESIYINSNNGEIKIGDIGIKHIYALKEQERSYTTTQSELGQCKWYLKERNTKQFDTFCFGLALLEMVCADAAAKANQHAFKFLN